MEFSALRRRGEPSPDRGARIPPKRPRIFLPRFFAEPATSSPAHRSQACAPERGPGSLIWWSPPSRACRCPNHPAALRQALRAAAGTPSGLVPGRGRDLGCAGSPAKVRLRRAAPAAALARAAALGPARGGLGPGPCGPRSMPACRLRARRCRKAAAVQLAVQDSFACVLWSSRKIGPCEPSMRVPLSRTFWILQKSQTWPGTMATFQSPVRDQCDPVD